MELKYIPYIKYVISHGTRFEKDKKLLFDPDGDVAHGKPLINYGWNQSGLRELIEALYISKNNNLQGFCTFYQDKIRECTDDLVSVLRNEGLIGTNFPALLRIKIKDGYNINCL